jgi:hypothetical protein
MLEKALKQVESVEKPSKLGFSRKSARSVANEAVIGSSVHDFQGLRTVVETFESEWKGGQKQVRGTRLTKEMLTTCTGGSAIPQGMSKARRLQSGVCNIPITGYVHFHRVWKPGGDRWSCCQP